MSGERLDSLFKAPVTSHLLLFLDAASGAEIGLVTLYLEGSALAFYYYAFYDLRHSVSNLGMFMMTTAAKLFAARGFKHLHLGSCYSPNALYKTQFSGVQFFNGFRWSNNLAELKFMLQRGQQEIHEHLLESDAYRNDFYGADLSNIKQAGGFSVKIQP